jgi:DNA-nicking Smr family endonuclease
MTSSGCQTHLNLYGLQQEHAAMPLVNLIESVMRKLKLVLIILF